MSRVVLVGEDDPLLRMGEVAIAEESAHKVYAAENADAAILVLEAQDHVTLLFTEVNMPGTIDGLELAEVVHARWPLVRLIVMSGRIAIPDDEVADDGVIIGKPCYAENIRAAIRAAHAQTESLGAQ